MAKLNKNTKQNRNTNYKLKKLFKAQNTESKRLFLRNITNSWE